MLKITGKEVYLSCGATDMRKSINGLMHIVQTQFNLDPFSNTAMALSPEELSVLLGGVKVELKTAPL